MKLSSTHSTIIIVLLVIAIGFSIWTLISAQRGEATLAPFAQCLEEEGATFYGTFWCPFCGEQKDMFGRRAARELPYVECSTANQGTRQVCIDEGIEAYPTWEFADGTRTTGVLSLEQLSEATGCMLPTENNEENLNEDLNNENTENLDTNETVPEEDPEV